MWTSLSNYYYSSCKYSSYRSHVGGLTWKNTLSSMREAMLKNPAYNARHPNPIFQSSLQQNLLRNNSIINCQFYLSAEIIKIIFTEARFSYSAENISFNRTSKNAKFSPQPSGHSRIQLNPQTCVSSLLCRIWL